MIRHLANNEIDKKKWDDCVQEAFNGIIYSYSWYLDIVTENWEALVENDYERILPLTAANDWGINHLYQPVFTWQLGVISKSILTEYVVGSFLDAIPKKFRYAEINLNTFNKVPVGNYNVFQLQNFELDLINSYENLYNAYSINLKQQLKETEISGLSLSKNIKPDEIIELCSAHRSQQIKNLKDEDFQKLKRISYLGIYKGVIVTYGVFSVRNDLLAGAIFARSKKKIILLFSGLSDEGKELKAMSFLIDSIIKEHATQHNTLDFQGANDPDLAQFYQSFGSSCCSCPHLTFNRLPVLTRLGIYLMKGIRSFFV